MLSLIVAAAFVVVFVAIMAGIVLTGGPPNEFRDF
jgi:Mn2+/Fe2+ NRAMP family transporter